jgi:hypothetical protein
MTIRDKKFYEEMSDKYPGVLKSFIPQVFNIKECYDLVKKYEEIYKLRVEKELLKIPVLNNDVTTSIV